MNRSILIVDDEFGLADLMADILRDSGYEVRVAFNGQLGLEALWQRRADIVLLDMMMPVMDGVEMLRVMRADVDLAAIPVILMTANAEVVRGTGQHDALLRKPFDLKQLLRLMDELMARSANPA